MKIAHVEIEGVSPLLMHAYRGEEPSQAKPPRGGKTQAYIDAQRRRDWERSAYQDAEGWHIPPENIEAAISGAAARFRKGTEIKRSLSVIEDRIPFLVPNGNGWQPLKAPLEEIWNKKEHVDIRGVVLNGRTRIDRCRPIFRNWRLRFSVMFDEGQLETEQIRNSLGGMCIGDFRPRYGRCKIIQFAVEE